MAEGHRLPTIPAVHARAMAVLDEPDLELRHLAKIVETDPALTAAVLRAANSASSAAVRRIGTAGDALVRIGLNTTRRIVLSAVIGESFRGLDQSAIDGSELWRHVLACGLLADALTTDEQQRSTAFTAGLLHDVGRMAMAQADPIKYSRIVRMARSGVDPLETEELGFGRSHAVYGVEAAEVWALPQEVIVVIGDHHEGQASDLSRAVWNARRIAAALGIGDGVVEAVPPAEDAEPGALLTPNDHALLTRMGGIEAVLKQIDWFSGAISGAGRAA